MEEKELIQNEEVKAEEAEEEKDTYYIAKLPRLTVWCLLKENKGKFALDKPIPTYHVIDSTVQRANIDRGNGQIEENVRILENRDLYVAPVNFVQTIEDCTETAARLLFETYK